MDIHYLHEFTVLADCCNFGRAADELYTSKSALSKHIAALEEELGQSLFIRTTRSVRLSPFGSRFLLYAREMDRTYTAMQQDLLTPATNTQVFRLGLFPILPVYGFNHVLTQFRERFPDFRFEHIEGEAEEIRRAVHDRKCDAGLILTGEEMSSGLHEQIVDHDEIMALVAEHSPIAAQPAIPVTDLKEHPLLLLPEKTYAAQCVLTACRSLGFEPEIAYQSQYGGMLRQMAADGMGIAFMAGSCAVRPGTRGIRVLPVDPPLPLTIRLVTRPDESDERIQWLISHIDGSTD